MRNPTGGQALAVYLVAIVINALAIAGTVYLIVKMTQCTKT